MPWTGRVTHELYEGNSSHSIRVSLALNDSSPEEFLSRPMRPAERERDLLDRPFLSAEYTGGYRLRGHCCQGP